jgi:hypothetical protein
MAKPGMITALNKHVYVFSNPCRQLRMKKRLKSKPGIQLLVQKYKAIFRIPENQHHYSKRDYRNAERKFLKYALEQRMIETQEELFKYGD